MCVPVLNSCEFERRGCAAAAAAAVDQYKCAIRAGSQYPIQRPRSTPFPVNDRGRGGLLLVLLQLLLRTSSAED